MYRPRSHRLPAALVLIALLIATSLGTGTPAWSRQDLPGVESDSYRSPSYQFTLSWSSPWQPVTASSANGVDRLQVNNGTSTVTFLAYPFAGDASACVQARVAQLQTDPEFNGLTPALDQEGAPLAGVDEVGAYAIYTYVTEEAYFVYLDCRPLLAGGAVLLIEQVVPVAAYNDQIQPRSELIGSLQLAGMEATIGDQPSSPDAETSTDAEPSSVPRLRWSVPADTPIYTGIEGQMAFDEGITYVIDREYFEERVGSIVAVDNESGDQLWSVSVGSGMPIDSAAHPAASKGVLVFVQGGELVALDGGTGDELWRVRIVTESIEYPLSPPAIANDRVFVQDWDGQQSNGASSIYSFDLLTGEMQWSFEIGSLLSYELPIVNGTVYAADIKGKVYALDAATGDDRWTFQMEWGSSNAPVVETNNLLVRDAGGTLYSLDPVTGDERWRASNVEGSFVVGGDSIVTIVDDTIRAIGKNDGDDIWQLESSFSAKVSVSADLAFISDTELSNDVQSIQSLYAVDVETGQERWRVSYSVERDMFTSSLSVPVIVDGIAYVTHENSLIAISALTGAELWRGEMGSQLSDPPRYESGLIIVGGYEGNAIYAVDPGDPPYLLGLAASSPQEGVTKAQLINGTTAMLESTPPSNPTMGLWRLTLAPNQDLTLPDFAGPASLYVMSGSLLVSDELQMIRGGNEDGLLVAGDSFILPTSKMASVRNDGSTNTVLLAVAILEESSLSLPSNSIGLEVELLGAGSVVDVPEAGMTLELQRVSLTPGSALPREAAFWPQLKVVESGAIEVTILQGIAEIRSTDSLRIEVGGVDTVNAGEALFLAPGAFVEIVNANQGPLTLYVVEGWGSVRFVGGAGGGCGGRCLDVFTP